METENDIFTIHYFDCKDIVVNVLKQFVTLLKVKSVLTSSAWCVNIEEIDKTLCVYIEEIDKTLKEFL